MAAFLLPNTTIYLLKMEEMYMEFFASAVETLKVLVMAIGAGPVSYTHLDVYKRQSFNNPIDIVLKRHD